MAASLCQTIQEELVDPAQKDGREPVTIADYASQALIGNALASNYPDDAVLSEERSEEFMLLLSDEQRALVQRYVTDAVGGYVFEEEICAWLDYGKQKTAPRTWVIDPIDGTVNFFHGSPWWCCSVAAQVGGRSVAGAVFAPELGWLFEATADGPALWNGRPLRVSDVARTDLAMIHTGADKADLGEHSFRFLRAVAAMAQRARITGAAAIDICLVAAGRADAFFESGIYLWDMAAAGLLVERAGGACEILRAYDGYRMAVLASNGRLHAPIRDALLPLLRAT